MNLTILENMKVDKLEWRIYYDDGSTFDNLQGPPEKAPPFGVICIIKTHKDNGHSTLTKWDWYYYRTDVPTWFGSDNFGLLDQLLHDDTNQIKGVKSGRTVMTSEYDKIIFKANNDSDFKKMTAYEVIDNQLNLIEKRTR